MKPFLPREIKSRYGDFVIREAKLSDKDGVLNIRKDMYGGLDFLPDMYDQMFSAPNGKAFLAQKGDNIVWFMSTLLIDNGENYYIKGNRISEDLEGKDIFWSFMVPISEWALSNGAKNVLGTNTNTVRRKASAGILDMNHMIYLAHQEKLHLSHSDIATTNDVLKIPFDDLVTYFRSNEVSSYLFPSNRIMVDIVPYKLMASNIDIMKGASGEHTTVFADVRIENGSARGVLSFGTLFKAQKVSYVYGIEFYGTDVISVQRHMARHMSVLQQKATGEICLMMFVQNDFPQKIADEICLKYDMQRVNCPGTQYTQWDFQSEVVIEFDILEQYKAFQRSAEFKQYLRTT